MKLPSVTKATLAFLRRAKPYALPLMVSSYLAYQATSLILHDAGRPAMPLDDSFIHFVYARRFAEGHPFTFAKDGTFSSGATSFLWPLALAPFYLLGFRGLDLVYPTWAIGTLLHAAVALETKRLAEGLAGKAAGVGAAAASLLFGAFAWFAWSGMETVGLAWIMTRTARLTAEFAEAPVEERTPRRAAIVALTALACPLIRPEGGVIALAAALVIALAMPASPKLGKAVLSRWPTLLPVGGVAFLPILNILLVGHARSTTAMVKWAVGNPYFQGETLLGVIGGNIHMLLTELLSGGPFTAIFIPEHTHTVLFAGAVALPLATFRARKWARGTMVAVIALGTLIPCTFLTILWNRVRYIYPFAPGWFVLVACLGSELKHGALWVADLTRRVRARVATWMKEEAPASPALRLEFVPAVVTGVFAGALATKLDWAIADLANSSRAISEQQVTLGMWARLNLPENAVIGVNDTGAIAYFSEHQTFDVVGLTTEGEARYWVAGPGSRYEHYERLGKEKLPTHFIVYPQWMAIPPILGRTLEMATVQNQSILGGATKVAYEADWAVLHQGDHPVILERGDAPIDELDVSDLESEEAHDYLVGNTNETQNLVTTYWGGLDTDVADGGRHQRLLDRFTLDFSNSKRHVLIGRFGADKDVKLTIAVDGKDVATADLTAAAWSEVSVPLPEGLTGKHLVEVHAPRPTTVEPLTFASMHYWLYSDSP
ncbi:MAG: hypothetical protein U0271_29160 [Polyangiaceae bacterium]